MSLSPRSHSTAGLWALAALVFEPARARGLSLREGANSNRPSMGSELFSTLDTRGRRRRRTGAGLPFNYRRRADKTD